MKALLIDDDAPSRLKISDALISRGITAFHPVENLQEGINVLEVQAEDLNLVICDYRGGSSALLQLFVQLSANLPCILFLDKKGALLEPATLPQGRALVPLERGNWEGLAVLLNHFRQHRTIDCVRVPEVDLVKVPAEFVRGKHPGRLFVRLARDYYCEASNSEAGVQHFFLEKGVFEKLLSEETAKPDPVLANPQASRGQLLQAASVKLEIIHNVVAKIGFTPEVQEAAKRTVALIVRAVGNNPKLAEILKGLKRHEGEYISSHSVMLAEVACALAHRIGWTSASTYLKLTTAALMHDLALYDNRLAIVRKLSDVTPERGFQPEDLHAIKMHPSYAADLSRKMDELPSDVDTMLMQHHERPGGDGFPRGLFHNQIAPLSCLFILAHDLLDFFLEHEAVNPSNNMMEAFLFHAEREYQDGMFKKMISSLASGDPLPT